MKAEVIIATDRPKPVYYQPCFYTLSGRVRVGRRGDDYCVEIVVGPHCWAEISESHTGSFDKALAIAFENDPHTPTRQKRSRRHAS